MREYLRTAFSAPQDAGVGQVANDGVVPVLARSGPVAQAVQISGDPLCAKALVDVLLKNDTHDSGLGFIDRQIEQLVLALVQLAALYEVIAIRGNAALETAAFYQLAQGGPGTDRGLFTLTVSLPETDVIGELVGMIVKPLFPLLGTPNRIPFFANHSTTNGVSSAIRPMRSNINTSRISNFP